MVFYSVVFDYLEVAIILPIGLVAALLRKRIFSIVCILGLEIVRGYSIHTEDEILTTS